MEEWTSFLADIHIEARRIQLRKHYVGEERNGATDEAPRFYVIRMVGFLDCDAHGVTPGADDDETNPDSS